MTYKLSRLACAVALGLSCTALTLPAQADNKHRHEHVAKQHSEYFERVATFPVYLNTDVENETVAEIVASSKDGNTLIYTDGAAGLLGFVDITNPASPQPVGVIEMGGEPTSVAVAGKYALVGVNTSPSFIAPSGRLLVIDIASRQIVSWFELGGQPDAVAVSPNQRYAAIAIENERDEDLGNGEPPQAPAGYLTIVDLHGEPADWDLRQVSFDGVPALFPDDAEPEFVAINQWNIAAVTLQENNHIILVHLPTGRIIRDFTAGTVDLEQVDNNENDLIELTASLSDIPREPDGITWISPLTMATADEGDLFGGSRGFSIFDMRGNVLYSAGNSLEHEVVRLGHYPEDRSENKGNEPENVTFGHFGKDRLLFVASERSSLIFVYKLDRFGKRPQLLQALPTTVGPEGILAIPQRDLLIAAGEEDARGDGVRGSLTIYQRTGNNTYPTVRSADRANGTPIPWAALSGLALDQQHAKTLYTIHDSFYQQSRIYRMNIRKSPAVITDEIVLRDTSGVLRAIAPHMVNDDNTVNLDQEGIAARADGGFWIASEGNGTVGDPARPVRTLNLLLRVSASGVIEDVVTLPASTNARQVRFGYEGVASVGRGSAEKVYVAIQREWADDPARHVRIGEYAIATGEWRFFYYPLDARESPNGGWVGLSEITALDATTFAVVERDNQANTDARIKRVYTFSIDGLTPLADPAVGTTPSFPVLSKTLVRDVLPDLQATGGPVLEKIEGMSVLPDGSLLIVNDNDGVDDSSGETQLIKIKKVF